MNTQSILILLMFISSSLKSANNGPSQLTEFQKREIGIFNEKLVDLIGEKDAHTFKDLIRQNPSHSVYHEIDSAKKLRSIQSLLMYVAGYLADVKATQLLLDHDPLIDVILTDYCEGFNKLPAFVEYRIKGIKDMSDLCCKQFGISTGDSTGKPNGTPVSDEDKIVKGLNSLIVKNKEKNTRTLQEHLPQLNKNLVSIICDYGWQGENDYQYHYDQLEKGFNYLTVHRLIEKKRKEQRDKVDQARRSLALLYSRDVTDA